MGIFTPKFERRRLLTALPLSLLGVRAAPRATAAGVWVGLCTDTVCPESFDLADLHEIKSPAYTRLRVAGPPPEPWPGDLPFPILDEAMAQGGAVFLADAPRGGRLLQFTVLPRLGRVGDTWHFSFPANMGARINRDLRRTQ